MSEGDEPYDSCARQRGVVQRHTTCEAAEQKRDPADGGCGGKAVDRGERETAQPVLDTEPGKRAQRAGSRARGSKEGREGTVHSATPPRDSRSASGELPQPQEEGGARSGRGEDRKSVV